MSLSFNRRGVMLLNNQAQRTDTTGGKLGADNEEHQTLVKYLEPSFDNTLKEVLREVYRMRTDGKLRPFVEGEPIGAYAPLPQPPRATDAEVHDYHRRKHEWQRDELRMLRTKNDETMKEMYRR